MLRNTWESKKIITNNKCKIFTNMLNNSNLSVQIKYLNEKGKVMSRFQRLVSAELERYKNRLAICKKQYKKAPEGTLKIRKLKNDYGITLLLLQITEMVD